MIIRTCFFFNFYLGVFISPYHFQSTFKIIWFTIGYRRIIWIIFLKKKKKNSYKTSTDPMETFQWTRNPNWANIRYPWPFQNARCSILQMLLWLNLPNLHDWQTWWPMKSFALMFSFENGILYGKTILIKLLFLSRIKSFEPFSIIANISLKCLQTTCFRIYHIFKWIQSSLSTKEFSTENF